MFREPKIPFPQADSFARVIHLCELLNTNTMAKDEITTNYEFDPRQTNYYTDAGRYLGLVSKSREAGEVNFCLTPEGQELFKLKYKHRQLKLVNLILRHKVFFDTFREWLSAGAPLGRDRIVEIMKNSSLYNVESDTTFRRRASTISGWINWILNLIA